MKHEHNEEIFLKQYHLMSLDVPLRPCKFSTYLKVSMIH